MYWNDFDLKIGKVEKELNSNIRCIEMDQLDALYEEKRMLNSNIRCIEIDNVPTFWFGGCGWIVTLDVLKCVRCM